MKPKLILIGIDGGSLELVEQWKEELPAFSHMMQCGAYANLESTLPAITCPAWASLFSGLNPAQLGFFYFVDLKSGRLINSVDWHRYAVWNKLNMAGIATGLFNIPMSYPPHPVNGIMVAGQGTPAGVGEFTYPREFREILGDDYEVMPSILLTQGGMEKKYSELLKKMLMGKIEMAKYLLENYPYEFYAIVLFATDSIQHYFWKHMDSDHPEYVPNSPYRDVIKDAYKRIDSFISYLIEYYPDSSIMVVSDHGFGAFKQSFGINKWLEDKGYLRLKPRIKQNWLDAVLVRGTDIITPRLSSHFIRSTAGRLPNLLRGRLLRAYARSGILVRLDWENTIAYSLGISGAIVLNKLCDTKTIDEIAGGLEREGDGFKVYRRDEVYFGGHIDKAPCLVIDYQSVVPSALGDGSKLWDRPSMSGIHRRNGLFFAYGNHVVEVGRLEKLKIADISPLILEYFKISSAEDAKKKQLGIFKG